MLLLDIIAATSITTATTIKNITVSTPTTTKQLLIRLLLLQRPTPLVLVAWLGVARHGVPWRGVVWLAVIIS